MPSDVLYTPRADPLAALRRRMIDLAYAGQEGHLPSSFSCLEIIHALYARVMRPQDRFILSKGHAALALYVVLHEQGLISDAQLSSFPAHPFEGHPNAAAPGVAFSTGSLGHGAPLSIGLALAEKMKGSGARVYCLLGDQEMNEGSVWEAALLASRFRLGNLVWVVDDNRSADNSLPVRDVSRKLHEFGWTSSTTYGHRAAVLAEVLAVESSVLPRAVVAWTLKGYGCTLFEELSGVWHHRKIADAAERDWLKEQCYE